MKNWKKYTLAVAIITVAGFAYVKNSQRNIPSDLRDAVADATESKDFDTAIPALEKVKVDVSAPKAKAVNTVPFDLACSVVHSFGKEMISEQKIRITEKNTKVTVVPAIDWNPDNNAVYGNLEYQIDARSARSWDAGEYNLLVHFNKSGITYEGDSPYLMVAFNARASALTPMRFSKGCLSGGLSFVALAKQESRSPVSKTDFKSPKSPSVPL